MGRSLLKRGITRCLFIYIFYIFGHFFIRAFWGSWGFLWLPGTCCLFFVCFHFSLYRYCRHEDNSQVLFYHWFAPIHSHIAGIFSL